VWERTSKAVDWDRCEVVARQPDQHTNGCQTTLKFTVKGLRFGKLRCCRLRYVAAQTNIGSTDAGKLPEQLLNLSRLLVRKSGSGDSLVELGKSRMRIEVERLL
jgi:hypothetical protein